MNPRSPNILAPPFRQLAAASAAFVLLCVLAGLAMASRWPLVHDAPLMHYVVFLMDHGLAPYRDIVEMNMPGAYMQEWAVVHTLGGGAHGWFHWDALTGVAAILSGMWIAGPGRRWAGLAGAGMGYLWHLEDGAWNLGQRDWVVAVLLLAAFGCLFECRRSGRALWMGGFICLCGAASSIKPLVILAPALVLPITLWLDRAQARRMLGWTAAGAIPPIAACLLFLARWHVWREFLATLQGLTAYYATLQAQGLPFLAANALPKPVFLALAAAVCLYVLQRSWKNWESNFLLLGSLVGLAFFLLQRKGWNYHRYTAIAFVMLWLMIEIDRSLRSAEATRRYAAAIVLAVATLGLPLKCLYDQRRTFYDMATIDHLQQDLTRLGGAQLSGSVQCLDMARAGCINVLYRMRLMQATGFIYDFYLFPERDTPVTGQLQASFLAATTARPPRVLILSSQIWPGDRFGYDELDRWPAFRDFLEANYTLASSYQQSPGPSPGYQLYLLR